MKKNIITLVMNIMAITFLATGCQKEMDLLIPEKIETTDATVVADGPSKNLGQCRELVLEGRNSFAVPQSTTSCASSPVTLYVDIDGENNVDGSQWDIPGQFNCPKPSNADLPAAKFDSMIKMVREDFSPFFVNVVTTLAEFQNASGLKFRLIITKKTAVIQQSQILGNLPAAAYIGSLLWGNIVPGFLFVNEYQGRSRYKMMAEQITHEFGHSFGLYHQSESDGTECGFMSPYRFPSFNLENGVIMGNSNQAKRSRWTKGASISLPCGQLQDDVNGPSGIGTIAGWKDELNDGMLCNATTVFNSGTINTVLVHAENRHAFYKNAPGSKKLTVTSLGNLKIKIGVYSSPGASPTFYTSSSFSVSVTLTGIKYFTIETIQPEDYEPYEAGGTYKAVLK